MKDGPKSWHNPLKVDHLKEEDNALNGKDVQRIVTWDGKSDPVVVWANPDEFYHKCLAEKDAKILKLEKELKAARDYGSQERNRYRNECRKGSHDWGE